MNKKRILIVLVLTLIVNLIGIYFFDVNHDYFGLIDYEDFIALFNIAIFGILSFETRKLKNLNQSYKKYFLFFLLMTILSSLQSTLLFKQKFYDGLLIQKEVISIVLLYFPLSKLISNKIIEKEQVFKILDTFAIIQLFLFTSQYFLSSKVSFLIVHTAQRYGEIRYYFNPILLDLFLIRNINDYINSGKNKIWNIIFVLLVLFETMVVQKYRLTSAALCFIVVLALIIGKSKTFNKKLHWFITIIFGIFMCNTRIVKDLISEFTSKVKSVSYSTRAAGRKLYLKTLGKHPILGGGYPKSEVALIAAGKYKKIYFTDNGIFGFGYIYGLVGIIWLALLWLKMIKDALKIYIKNDVITYILFPIFLLVTCVNELHWYWHHGMIVFILFILLLECERNEFAGKGDKNGKKIN